MFTTTKQRYLFVAVILVAAAVAIRFNYLPPVPPKIEPQPTGVSQAAIEEFKREAREDARFRRGDKQSAYKVATGGTAAVNGVYVRAGTYNNADYYAKPGYVMFWDGSSKWIIAATLGGPSIYEGLGGDIDSVPTGIWAQTGGAFPSPQVLPSVKHH